MSFYPDLKYCISDLTVIMGVRLSQDNLWIKDRLQFFKSWYEPCPKLIIVDFGSSDDYSEQIKNICIDRGYFYHFHPDEGGYCPSLARNYGFSHSNTDLLFFSDPDVILERNTYAKMVDWANKTSLRTNIVQRLTIPVYHLTQQVSEKFELSTSDQAKEYQLFHWGISGIYSEIGKVVEFVAPYSNSFLCHRDYFELSGGYSSDFRGHGSEDFEYIVRLNILFDCFPLPEQCDHDIYQPTAPSFFGNKRYAGFRRLAELETLASELQGFKSFHLWHPKNDLSGWYDKNDWKRQKLNEVFSRYLEKKTYLLEEDYIDRKKSALCLGVNDNNIALFFPLRLLGYGLTFFHEQSVSVIEYLKEKKYDHIFISYDNYLDKTEVKPLVDIALSLGIELTFIFKGVFPHSLRYLSSSFVLQDICPDEILQQGLDREKGFTLLTKDLQVPSENVDFLCAVEQDKRTKCLIVFQDPLDPAILLAGDSSLSYQGFLKNIFESCANNTDYLFIFALPSVDFYIPNNLKNSSSIVIFNIEDVNLHGCVAQSDMLISYNSDIALLALALDKEVFHAGRFFSSMVETFSPKITDLKFLEDQNRKKHIFNRESLALFLTCLLEKKYSFTHDSKSKNTKLLSLNVEGRSYQLNSSEALYGFSPRSYAAAKLGLNLFVADEKNILDKTLRQVFKPYRLLRKFIKNPYRYVSDSNIKTVRSLRRYFKK